MKKLFGTDGVRGVANSELTPEIALNLGRAGAHVLAKTPSPKILVATDSRRSGDMLVSALSAGLCSVGAEVYLAGVIPTPAVAYLVRHLQFDAGVMISASHNPMADNGIKFFSHTGYKLSDALEEEIEGYVAAPEKLPRPTGVNVGTVHAYPSASEEYAAYLHSIVPGLSLKGVNIALDSANGATSYIAAGVFESLGASVHPLFNTPDGTNINENCGSTHIEALADYVKANKLDLGLAFDGDGDRMLAVDGNGEFVDGDEILAICGLDMKERGLLPGDAIVATSMSNQGFEVMCRQHGITLHRADVGDRYVLEKMLADNLPLGGEQSGHVIFGQHSTTGDGMLSGLLLVDVLARKKKPLAELRRVMEHFPQVLINVNVDNAKKREWASYPEIADMIAKFDALMAGEGRILVRPSGTEPLVRVMIEGRDMGEITRMAEALAAIIGELLV